MAVPDRRAVDGAHRRAPAGLNAFSRHVLSRADVLGQPGDCKRLAAQTMRQALMGVKPGHGTSIHIGEGHDNKGGLPVITHLLAMAKSPAARAANIRTVMFEFPSGNEAMIKRGIQKVTADIARTPGGASAFFNKLPHKESAGPKWFYMIDQARKMGFNIECIDSTSPDLQIRNRTMNQHIRAKTDKGEGVIVINGAQHIGPMQSMLLSGQEKPGGPQIRRPVNAVSLTMVDAQYPKATDDLLASYTSYRLPPQNAHLVRFAHGMEDMIGSHLPS